MAKQERAIATRETLVIGASRVFARLHYETARVADILEEAAVTQGAFYFHFPEGKKQIAQELITRREKQFVRVREEISDSGLDGLSGLLELTDALGRLLRSDHVAQAGARLVIQASTVFPEATRTFDSAWIQAISSFLHRAEGEKTLRGDVDVPLSARTIVYLFTGAQVSSFVNDTWEDLPSALETIEPFVTRSLAADGFVRSHPNT
jgi:AcrR family transcriptional regulator